MKWKTKGEKCILMGVEACCNNSSTASWKNLKEILIVWQIKGNFSTGLTDIWWNAKYKVRNAYSWVWELAATTHQLLLEGTWSKSWLSDNLKKILIVGQFEGSFFTGVTNKWWSAKEKVTKAYSRHGGMLQWLVNCFLKALAGNPNCLTVWNLFFPNSN